MHVHVAIAFLTLTFCGLSQDAFARKPHEGDEPHVPHLAKPIDGDGWHLSVQLAKANGGESAGLPTLEEYVRSLQEQGAQVRVIGNRENPRILVSATAEQEYLLADRNFKLECAFQFLQHGGVAVYYPSFADCKEFSRRKDADSDRHWTLHIGSNHELVRFVHPKLKKIIESVPRVLAP